MVVAQVIGDLSIGGAERLFVNLCNTLDAEKTIVVLIGEEAKEPNLVTELAPGTEVHRVRVRQRSWPIDVWRLSRLLRRSGCDVVHTHMFWPNLYGTLAARLAGIRVIVTSEHGQNDWKQSWHKWLEVNVISRYAFARLCVSEDILRMRRDRDGIPAGLLRLVPNGTVVPANVADTASNELIGSVGRLVDAKDYPTLVRAVATLARRGIQVQLEIVGEGGDRPRIEQTIREEGAESCVILAGSQTNVGAWLGRWCMFVSSSVREGQPVALLEAMAVALPCVVTSVGGVPDTLADGVEGIVVPPDDPAALADGIERLLGDATLRESYGAAARARVMRDFSIESLAARCKDIYGDALGHAATDSRP